MNPLPSQGTWATGGLSLRPYRGPTKTHVAHLCGGTAPTPLRLPA